MLQHKQEQEVVPKDDLNNRTLVYH